MSSHALDDRSDAELIAAANRGEAAAFESLYQRYCGWVANLAWRFTKDRELALDVMQDTFLYLLRKFPGFELTSQLKTFLYPVVRHNALAARRKSRHSLGETLSRPADPPQLASPEMPAELSDLHAAVEALDSGHREVLILRYVDGLALQEIAQAMGLPLGTVKSRLHNALAQLRENQRLRNYFELE